MNPTTRLPPAEPLPFFVYGTLLPGQPNAHYWEGLVTGTCPATFEGGLLYDMGHFPMLVPAFPPHAARPISGLLLYIHPAAYPALLARLDELEGYNPQQPDESPYQRRAHPVRLSDGSVAQAWVYLGQRQFVAGKRPIEQDDWPSYAAARAESIAAWWADFDSLFPASRAKQPKQDE